MTVNVTPVNDPPTGADNSTLVTLEDTSRGFVASDFGFSDGTDNNANGLGNVIILTAPSSGTLQLGGTDQTTFPLTVIAGNLAQLTFKPAADANDGNIAKPFFTFKVQDNGGTASGGVDTSLVANTMTLSVVSVNDAPNAPDKTVSTKEDNTYTFLTGDFFTAASFDTHDTPANQFNGIRITTLPNAGTLTLNGQGVAAGDPVTAAQIAGGNLKFVPAANANGPTYAQFQFQVKDNGGVQNTGVDTDPTPATMTVAVGAVNDAPRGSDTTITIGQATTKTFSTSDFGFSDPFDVPANGLLSVTISSLPLAGTLKFNNVAITQGQLPLSVLATDITGNKLTFTPTANDTGIAYATFTFQVRDDGGVLNGGVDTDPAPKIITINVSGTANAAPVGIDSAVTAQEDVAYAFKIADFQFNDAPANNNLKAVKITTLPAANKGTLLLNGTPITPAQVAAGFFVQAIDMAIGNFQFLSAANQNGAPLATFQFQVQDDGGTAVVNGVTGVDLDASPNVMTVNVTAVNDAPSGADATVTVQTNSAYTFHQADFGFTDANDTPANSLASVVLSTLPLAGSLTLNGNPVNAGDSILIADLDANRLVFTPVSGQVDTSFAFQVRDNGSNVPPNANLDPTPNTISIHISIQHHAPAGTDKTITPSTRTRPTR